jgi:hypothetical protein
MAIRMVIEKSAMTADLVVLNENISESPEPRPQTHSPYEAGHIQKTSNSCGMRSQ